MNRVYPGRPVNLSASALNHSFDAADQFFRQQQILSRQKQQPNRQGDVILVRNETGDTRQRFEVLGLGDVLIKPTENIGDFIERPAFSGVVPTMDHYGRWAILLENLEADGIGQALVGGVTATSVQVVNEYHRFADVAPDKMDMLVSAGAGSAQLLYVQPLAEREQADIAWAIARIGLPVMDVPRFGVVIECDYDNVNGSLIVTCVPLRGVNFSYDAESPERIVAWAGIDPIIVADDLVKLTPIRPMEMNPEIRYHAEAIISVPRSQLDMPDMQCLTAYTEPCSASQSSDICLW
jgi:hypothetical protein